MQIPKRSPQAILITILLLSRIIQGFSQTDVEFWFVAPEITIGHGNFPGGEPVYFRVSALDLDASVRIYQPANPAGMDTTFTVPASSTVSIDGSPWINDLENKPGGLVLNKGVHITSSNLITVYYDEDEYWNQDIFALKGKNALGLEFYTPFQNVWANGNYNPLPYSSTDIVATEDNTVITITPTANLVGGYSAGNPFTITLNQGETFSCLATSQSAAGHMGGTHIVSNKPIAVTIKDDSVAGNVCRDLIGDQTVPLLNIENSRIVGYEYIVMRGKINLINPNANPPDPDGVPTGERIFILATEPNTEVFIDGVLFTTLNNPGEQAAYEIRNNSTHVRGDKPIMILHSSGFGCELGGAVLPTIDGCTGSVEVSFTRSTDRDFYLNIMTIDAAKNSFTVHYEDGSSFPIPGTWFESVGATDYVCLKKANKYFPNSRPGGVPQGEVVKITNSVSVFHLGLIEGGTTTGCKYGYFSDYSAARGDVLVVESGSKSIFRCFNDTIQLRANGGISYTWSPSTYLDNPFIATPIATPPPGVHNYDVTLNRGCFPDTTISVIVGIAEEIEAFFEMDKWYICAPDTVTFDNQSFGVDLSNATNVQWDFDLQDPSNPFVYDISPVMQQPFTNTSDSIETKTVQLVVWNSQSCISEFRRDILVRPEISAGFTNDISDGCHPVTVGFTNTSSGNTDRYKWDLGDGTSANTADVIHTYLNQGMADSLYHVEMVAISPFFCSDSVATDIAVYPYIEAAFAIDTFQGCSPLVISIDNNSAGYIEEYEWTLGDGATSSTSANSFSHTYSNLTALPIQYNLRLVVKNNTRGCTDTLVRVISVFPEVTSAFLQDQASACHGAEIIYTNMSSPTASIFEWDFGDGGSNSSRDPSHTFENMTPVNADYLVRLVSTTPNLCRDTSYQTIRIHPYIQAQYSVDEFQGCAPFQVVIKNTSEGAISSYEWDWGDGSPTTSAGDSIQTHLYQNNNPAALTNNIQLIVQNTDGCADTLIRDITVFPQVSSQFTQDVTDGCNELLVNFTNQSSASATSFLWEFGDGGSSDQQDPPHLFQNPGLADSVYTTRLIAVTDENCSDTSQADITVYSYVKADFTFSQATLCPPYDLTMNNSSLGGVNFHWDFGDGSDTTVLNSDPVMHRFTNPSPNDPATYQIILTVGNAQNCFSVQQKEITVMPSVDAGFTADLTEGCNPLTVNFSNTSSGAITYIWDFDNGQSSSQNNPSMTFENYGSNDTIFNVRLMAASVSTCQDSFFMPILVHPHVDADFAIEYQRQCSPAEVTFHNSSVNGQQFSWSFDGNPLVTNSSAPINQQFTNNSLTNSASYPIDLTVTSAQGCTAAISKQVSVFHRIEAGFTSIDEGCHLLDVNFTNTSLGATDYKWDFGDDNSSILENPLHTFTNTGSSDSIFNVKLTVISENFCRDSINGPITLFPGPKAKFDVDQTGGCSPLIVSVQNLSETGDTYTWNFGDGSAPLNLANSQAVTHSYYNDQPAVQLHELRLDVMTDKGCSDFITQNITVYPSVEADFERDSAGCSPYDSHFSNRSERASSFIWEFGDGGFSYVTEPGHTYVNTGEVNYVVDVELKAYSEYGCTDSMTRNITIYPSPEARFSYSPIYQYFPSSTVTLVNQTNAGSYSYEWDFDDGDNSVLRDPGTHIYAHWGEYYIQLTASNDQCSDSIAHWIKIFPPQPIAAFVPDIDSGCVPLTVSFTNNSIYGEDYLWEFDDGSISTAFEPNHTFREAGYYYVKLSVQGEGGVDYAFHEIEVYPLPELDFFVEPSIAMMPEAFVKSFNLSKYGTTYRWDFGDGTSYDIKDTIHLYTAIGVYDVSLTAWTKHGCEAFMLLPEAVTVIGEGEIEYPTAFKPSNSGPGGGWYNPGEHLNEVFYPLYEGVDTYELIIYNRWGEKLFQTYDIRQGWDGYHRGDLCSQAVYIWKAKVTYGDGSVEILTGDVTLLHREE
ncbi:MAG: PKD domain-containing protein [Bacteroidetes bacterium]|nr:PKD domain-containing protein [Bacteroidota bacterium]